jgi:AraC-like DNA-binding protein
MVLQDLHFVKFRGHLFADEMVLQPTAEWEIETDAWMFLHLHAGEACWIDAHNPCLLNPGDTLVMPPAHAGILRASVLVAATIIYFRFRPELLTGFLTLNERLRVERKSGQERLKTRVFPRAHPVSGEFARLCQVVKDRNSPLARSRLLQIAVTVLVEGDSFGDAEEAAFLPASKRAQLLFRQLSEAELIEHSPADMAARCGCSIRHFNKLFRAHGVSLRVQQQDLQLAKARQLLAETDMRVIEVAVASGFREQGRFSSAFKRRFGVTPSEWRRHADTPVTGRSCRAASQRFFVTHL